MAREHLDSPGGPWDEEHIKALLHFPRFPIHLIQQEPWQTWVNLHGGLKAVYAYLRDYPLSLSHHRILEVVLSNPEEISDVYANRLNISRATYFYQLREFLPALVQALNHWGDGPPADAASPPSGIPQSPPFSLPNPLTGLIGAEPTLEILVPLLLREDVRLLTLLGPGGIGKTRLSIELARRACGAYGDSVCFIDLSPLRDPQSVPAAIAQALGLPGGGDPALKAYLRTKEFLLVLDNFEHILPAASLVTELLDAAPRLKILITSRAALRVYGEHEFLIAPLATPQAEAIRNLAQLAQSPSVALFVQRARAVNPGFTLNHDNAEAVFELCLRLEGFPLMIELAAFQIKYFSPQAMLVRLSSSKRLNFLGQGPKRRHPHQQTPRDNLDWSYNLLKPDLQRFFSRLAVFRGSFTIDAANTVCILPEEKDADHQPENDDIPGAYQALLGLTALVDQSLLQQETGPDGEPCFLMFRVTREYALERLDQSGEMLAIERGHAFYYLQRVEEVARAVPASGPLDWLERLQREYSNIRAAVQWTIDQREGELGLRFIVALWNFWKFCGYQSEGRQITQTVLEQTSSLQQPLRAQVQRLAGWLAHDLRDTTAMQWAFQASLELSDALGDRLGIGLARQGLGELAHLRGQWDLAHEHIQASIDLFQALDDQRQIAWSLDLTGRIALSRGNLVEAQEHIQKSLDWFRAHDAPSAMAFVSSHLAQALLYQGFFEPAEKLFHEALGLSQATGDTRGPVVAFTQNYLAEIAIHQNQFAQAREQIGACLTLCKEVGYTWCTELADFTAGHLAMQAKDYRLAGGYFRECLLVQQSLKESWRSLALIEVVASLSTVRSERRDLLAAARLYGAAEFLRNSLQIAPLPLYRAQHITSLKQLSGHLTAEALQEAWSAGQSLSLDQSVIYALRCLE